MDNPHKIKETFILLVLSISILCICYNLLQLCDCFRCCKCPKCPKCKKNNQINMEESSEATTSSTDTLTNIVIATIVDPCEFNENYVVIATPIHSEQRMY
ncbi:MAG: hypothetical protein CMH79_05190 [Nitrospinae bacterium]|nr:hypothetical protein [Nitrospinota bacterium]